MKSKWQIYLIPFILAFLAVGADAPKSTPPTPATTAAPQNTTPNAPTTPFGRTDSLNFEDEIVEGMNKNPFDSLTNIGKKDDRTQGRLYKKKTKFSYEIKLTIREMGLLQ